LEGKAGLLGAFLLYALPQLVTNEWAALALWLVALWLLVTGGVRLAALIRPAGRALPDVTDNIDANEFDGSVAKPSALRNGRLERGGPGCVGLQGAPLWG
jgi:hypothetical protein